MRSEFKHELSLLSTHRSGVVDQDYRPLKGKPPAALAYSFTRAASCETEDDLPDVQSPLSSDWVVVVRTAIEKIDSRRLQDVVFDLQRRLATSEKEIEDLKANCEGASVAIQTMAPEPYDLINPILVVVRKADDEYTATFFDANLSTAGENETEAVHNLKMLILDVFDSLSSKPVKKLGPALVRRLAVLREFLKKRG